MAHKRQWEEPTVFKNPTLNYVLIGGLLEYIRRLVQMEVAFWESIHGGDVVLPRPFCPGQDTLPARRIK